MGADLAGICREAAMEAVRRVIAGAHGGAAPDVSRLKITQSDLYAALARNAARREDHGIDGTSAPNTGQEPVTRTGSAGQIEIPGSLPDTDGEFSVSGQ